MGRTSESSIVTKCALVLDVLTQSRRPLGFSDIAARTSFAKSSCHRILSVLQSEQLVEYDKASREYRPGRRIDLWTRASFRRRDLQDAASDLMVDLSEETHMNVALSIMDRDSILYLRTVDFFSERFASHAGDHAPLHCTAAGKVFLAQMAPERLQVTLAGLKLEKFTENTITSLEDLLAGFSAIRRDGFASARGEETLQVTGIAAPILNEQSQISACLSLWSTSEHSTPDEVIAQAPRLKRVAAKISDQVE